ncbi:hypothetical protein [Zemynaea arenosa]|uniref:hypothetical protein n=1 Tax=Zemynaea arenosa TaxID=2561931 RepID=UPI001E653843|nr:hypothetical protein [Massilia arenosa]
MQPILSRAAVSRLTVTVLLGAALLALAGCATTTPAWDASFGQSVQVTLAAQVRDPAAAAQPRPGDSLDGRAAKRAQERYEQSFTERPVQDSLMNGLAK